MRATRSIGRTLSSSAAATALQHLVAGGVAMGVVDALEVVDIGHQQQRRLAAARHAVDLTRQRQLETASIGQPGERVAAGEVDQGVDQVLQPPGAAGLATRCRTARVRQQLQGLLEVQRGGGGAWKRFGAWHEGGSGPVVVTRMKAV